MIKIALLAQDFVLLLN